MFSRRTASEVLICYDNIARFYLFHKILVNVLHAVCRQFLRIRRIQITCRNDDIRIDIVSVFKYMTLCCFHALSPFLAYAISSGPDNFPVMALAAATAGLAR